jgi:phage shock protein PspC (stress-responsive transcriptional regulator)
MTDTDTKTCPSCFKDIDARALRCEFCTQRQGDVVGLYRDVPGRALGGVCAAIAQHFNWDVTLMRIAFVASFAFTGGLVLWVYAAAWLMTPFAAHGKAPLARLTDWLGNLFSPAKPGGVQRV